MKVLEEHEFLAGQVEAFKVGRWCHVRKGGRPRDQILSVLMRWIHAAMYFSYFHHVDIVRKKITGNCFEQYNNISCHF